MVVVVDVVVAEQEATSSQRSFEETIVRWMLFVLVC